jgi:MFS family permease
MIDIEKIERRTVRSFYDDGLTEIALGLILLVLGGYFYTQEAMAGSKAGSVLSALFVIVVFAAAFLVNRLLRFLKRRITYPRTGYVSFKKKEPNAGRRAAAAAVGMIIGASLAVLYSLSPSVRTLLPAVNGLLFAVAVLLIANRVGVIRFYILAAASAVIGVGVTAAGIADIKGVSLYYGLFGAATLVSGLAALIVYLRRSPRPEPEIPEGPDAH